MAQTNLLELAKQGDPQAIATLMNRSLQPRGMTASVDRQGSCLLVTLQAEQVPNRQVLTAFVQNGISNLGVSSIQLVKIAGQQFGMDKPAWTQDLQIDTPGLGDLALDDLEPAEPTAPPHDAGDALDELDDIAPAPNPVGDILSELTAPPPSPTFEPGGQSPAESPPDLEDNLASGDLPPLGDDFSGDLSLGTNTANDIEFSSPEFGSPDFGNTEFGGTEFGSTEFGGTEFGATEFGGTEFGGTEFGSPDFGSTEFGGTDFGNTEFGGTEFSNTEFSNTEFGSPDFDDASLSNADFDLDLSSADSLGESSDAADLEGVFAEDLKATGEPTADSGQEEDDFGAIAAGFETEAQFDDLLPGSSTAEFDQSFDQSTDFAEPVPTPAPYIAEEISLDLDLDDIQLPPVTAEGDEDWDADLEFGNLTGEDLSGFTADPSEPAEPGIEAAADLEALNRGGESSTAAVPSSAPAEDAAPWLSELPPEFAIDVTLDFTPNDSLLDPAGVALSGSEESRAIAPESLALAQDLELAAQDLYFESGADSYITPESSPTVASSDFDADFDADLDNLGNSPSNVGSPDSPLDADLFDEPSDIPLSQLPTEIPPSEIRDGEPDTPDFLDMPLSGIEFDEAAFNSPYDRSSNRSPANEFTLEDETAPTELMSALEETLPSELLVDDLDDLDDAGGFEMDNLGLGLDSLEREDFQPSAPEASGGDDFGLGGLEQLNLDAPAADGQNEPEPLPETEFGLDDDDETTILLDPSAYPEASLGSAPPSPELDREELDWLANEVAASANPPVSPLSSAEEGWSYGIPPAPPPPQDTFAYPASAPQPLDPAAARLGEPEAAAETESLGGRATNLLYAVLLALLAWILALIGRSLWTELTQPEPSPPPAVDVSPQSQDLGPEPPPTSTVS